MDNKDGLYGALEDALKKADVATDCASLFDLPEIRAHAKTVNRVSDYLGNMWRKGDVIRLPAPPAKNTKARWVYAWKGRVQAKDQDQGHCDGGRVHHRQGWDAAQPPVAGDHRRRQGAHHHHAALHDHHQAELTSGRLPDLSL